MTIGDRIKQIRKDTGLTQKDFAERLGLFRGSLANYECGRANPIASVVVLICKEFNINEEWLRTGNGEMYKSIDYDDVGIVEWVADVCKDKSMKSQRKLVTLIKMLSNYEADIVAQAVEILIEKAEQIVNEEE